MDSIIGFYIFISANVRKRGENTKRQFNKVIKFMSNFVILFLFCEKSDNGNK
ncbi:hypothetical protein HMPREF3226_01292 [Prevotella corporis]|uniref:Uncharacterized protein n=1 Tax=Prevotella corporis TaxID=28128 RepID=A0A133Q9B0_9BACT|nr:hypothetical protein HMPREF3226_01292 [Prevotella corporis]